MSTLEVIISQRVILRQYTFSIYPFQSPNTAGWGNTLPWRWEVYTVRIFSVRHFAPTVNRRFFALNIIILYVVSRPIVACYCKAVLLHTSLTRRGVQVTVPNGQRVFGVSFRLFLNKGRATRWSPFIQILYCVRIQASCHSAISLVLHASPPRILGVDLLRWHSLASVPASH